PRRERCKRSAIERLFPRAMMFSDQIPSSDPTVASYGFSADWRAALTRISDEIAVFRLVERRVPRRGSMPAAPADHGYRPPHEFCSSSRRVTFPSIGAGSL